MNKDKIDAKILAVAGKGGVGKTSLAAVMVKLLVAAYPDKRILAIDADPAVGLSTALGVDVKLTVDDIRKEVVANAEDGNAKAAIELLGEARYRIFDALVEMDGFSFIEQINRRVMEKVTHLMLITDSSKKGTQVVQTIKQVADELVMYDKVGVIANRLPNLDVKQYMDVGDIPVLSYILSDASLAEFDIKGESVFYLDDDAAIVRGAKEALIGIGILEA